MGDANLKEVHLSLNQLQVVPVVTKMEDLHQIALGVGGLKSVGFDVDLE